MKVLVVRWGSLQTLPPAINLIQALLGLGHSVTALCNGPCLPILEGQSGFSMANLGEYPAVGASGHMNKRIRSLVGLRSYLRQHVDEYDVIWTTTDNSAVYCCDLIPPDKHVLQLAELVEHVPLFGSKDWFTSKSIVKQARSARRVVVPEINRAYIQRVYWDLPVLPAVLPNKPVYKDLEEVALYCPNAQFPGSLTSRDTCKLLYQGGFTPDRDLRPYCEAVQRLGGDYELVLMGKSNAYSDQLCDEYERVTCIGRYDPPAHLLGAGYADAGILPYASKGERIAHLSPLNALYCAPNKLWEYALAGVPMISNFLPGLNSLFAEHGIGRVVAEGDVECICSAIKEIRANQRELKSNCRAFYSSVDVPLIVERILCG